VKIIVLTGATNEEFEQRCIEIGVNAYFRKGTDLDGVLDTMVALMAN
jgi:AmiR/NasT family two-component response regulator